jgi:glucose/arabinose dehydrogenase/mono/diheme cytochrome c family protein
MSALALALTIFASVGLDARLEAAAIPARKADAQEDDLRPGLVGAYRSLVNKNAGFARVDRKPAFYLGHSSPDPRLPPGPFEVVWTGTLFVKDSGPVTFEAFVAGEATVEVDGAVVLQGRGKIATARVKGKQKLDRQPGHYPIKIRFRSLKGVPARIQLWWQGPTFSPEPIPPWLFLHRRKDRSAAVSEEELLAQGRVAVGRLGCARCHPGAFPGLAEPPPGPSLADLRGRLSRAWLLRWLDDPAKVHADARMPALFTSDRAGFVERWLLAEHLLGPAKSEPTAQKSAGDHRAGRLAFLNLGCAACHLVPDTPREAQPDLDRLALRGLGDRLPPANLATFLENPHNRYPDGRMPRLPLSPQTARDVASYLLMWSKPSPGATAAGPPTEEEIAALVRRVGASNSAGAAVALLGAKGCAACHPGLEVKESEEIPLKQLNRAAGCLSARTFPRFTLNAETRKAITAFLKVAARERHRSPFAQRQRLLQRAGCAQCHARDSDRPPPIEVAGSTLGGAFLQDLPFQRTPRLTYPNQKYLPAYLVQAVRDGVAGLRSARYSYRMPAFGKEAEVLVQALAEADGELPPGPASAPPGPADPTLGPGTGPALAGFQGYACVSCHVWNGRLLSQPDPGAIAPDLTRMSGRIRREWFNRFLEEPARSLPGTPMPTIFPHGQAATLTSVLDGDPVRQRDALWAYFALGKDAPSPQPPPPLIVPSPPAQAPPLVAQIPIRVSGGPAVESITLLYPTDDLVIYDLGAGALHSVYIQGQILRGEFGRLRTYSASRKIVVPALESTPVPRLVGQGKPQTPSARMLEGYDRLKDGVRLRSQLHFLAGKIAVIESVRLLSENGKRHLVQELRLTGVPAGRSVEIQGPAAPPGIQAVASEGKVKLTAAGKGFRVMLTPSDKGFVTAAIIHELPRASAAPAVKRPQFIDPGRAEGSLERPGYRAIAYPRPRMPGGEDLVMPGAVAVRPRDGRVFIASMKLGEIFTLDNPDGDGKQARFRDYAGGLFQEAYGLLAEDDALYVLHRRNLTRITETEGRAEHFDRVAHLSHGVADTYDYAYGLVRDRTGGFVLSYAPYANRELPGSGGAIRLSPGTKPKEIAFGFRNPFGWCTSAGGEVFFTDNQGDWVATNKLCHVVEGRYYGYPNPVQKQHAGKPAGNTAVWVPYGWARSINGAAFDTTEGKFGPFAGQVFLAELMFGGAIIRANLEKVNGEYQGACFPFWGKGLLGPLALAFDRRGHLYVGSITEPGWMAQPDRGALYRIDFTGQVPFEIQSLHVRPQGFRMVFTRPVNPKTARDPASYHIEHYRYEYTGAYGSPELDRTSVAVREVKLAADGRSAELTVASLVRGRVYLVSAPAVRSPAGEALIHSTGAYTLNEIPSRRR